MQARQVSKIQALLLACPPLCMEEVREYGGKNMTDQIYLSRKAITKMTYEELYENSEALRDEMNKRIDIVMKERGLK